MKTSDSVGALAVALAKAQAKMAGARKESNNPAFNSKYADLASVVEAIKGPLADNGLSYVQTPCTNDKDEVGVETILLHSSGEWIKGDAYFMPVAKANAHGFGSILTYARRYSLSALVGIAPEDDDANEGVGAKRPNTATQVAVDEFDKLPDDAKEVVMNWADEIKALVSGGATKQAVEFFNTNGNDHDGKLAIWSKLDSKTRSAMKPLMTEDRKAA